MKKIEKVILGFKVNVGFYESIAEANKAANDEGQLALHHLNQHLLALGTSAEAGQTIAEVVEQATATQRERNNTGKVTESPEKFLGRVKDKFTANALQAKVTEATTNLAVDIRPVAKGKVNAEDLALVNGLTPTAKANLIRESKKQGLVINENDTTSLAKAVKVIKERIAQAAITAAMAKLIG